jgi:RNA polymerase sigma factor (sigma-70 family)
MSELKQVDLHYDEVEALRLCDLEGLTQEQAGQQMGVSRGTVQRILTTARKKMASAIVNGEALILTESKQ